MSNATHPAIEMLRQIRPAGCAKCDPLLCNQAVNGSIIDSGWCSKCLAKHIDNDWAKVEILRRFAKRYGGAA